MADLIDRQAAIAAIYEHENNLKRRGVTVLSVDNHKYVLATLLESVPSAQPKCQKGKWVEEDDAIIHGHCSNCGWASIWQETDVFGMNYCPNCGAQMEVEE